MWPMTTGYVHVRAEPEQWAPCHLPQNDREIDKGKGTRCLMRVYGSSYWLIIFTTTWIPTIVLPCMRQETLGHIFAGNIIKCNFVDATIQKKYIMEPFVQVMDHFYQYYSFYSCGISQFWQVCSRWNTKCSYMCFILDTYFVYIWNDG